MKIESGLFLKIIINYINGNIDTNCYEAENSLDKYFCKTPRYYISLQIKSN